jgi:hypothetical protein
MAVGDGFDAGAEAIGVDADALWVGDVVDDAAGVACRGGLPHATSVADSAAAASTGRASERRTMGSLFSGGYANGVIRRVAGPIALAVTVCIGML